MRSNIVKQPVIQGGLEVKDLLHFNEALPSEWLWRLMNEKGNLEKGGCKLHPNMVRRVLTPNISYVYSLQRYISKGWEKFSSPFSFEVGNGSSIYFWNDRWCGFSSLRDIFSALFVLAK